MELSVEVIRDLGHAYLPHVYDKISFSASLKEHHIQSLQSLPVSEVLEATLKITIFNQHCPPIGPITIDVIC